VEEIAILFILQVSYLDRTSLNSFNDLFELAFATAFIASRSIPTYLSPYLPFKIIYMSSLLFVIILHSIMYFSPGRALGSSTELKASNDS